jgi:predicted O-methyltransferase YrrM
MRFINASIGDYTADACEGKMSGMNPKDLWAAVDRYLNDLLVRPDDALNAALRASTEAGLPNIHVAPNQGKFLHLLARTIRATRILEIGTLGGYSTIWLARALPANGKLITLEYEPKHATVARENFARAGVADRIDLRVGRAIELLPALETESPFDLVFIDADKPSTSDYLMWAVKLTRPGSLIVIDNVIRDGKVADASSEDANVKGVRRALDQLAQNPRLCATAFQMVGGKGYDGLAIALVTE